MFGHIQIYKVTNLKVYSKGRYFVFYFFIPFQELQRTAHLDYKVVFLYLWYHKDNPAHWNLNGWGAGRTLGWALHASKWKPSAGFYITVFLMETNCFHKMLDVIFISSCVMSAKAALCAALPGKPRSLPLQQRLPLAENSFAYKCDHK